MRKRQRGLVVLAAMILLLIPIAASAADQTVEVSVLPEDTLSIDVESEAFFGGVLPGESTELYEFWMGITNTKSSGWQVTVSATDLQAYHWEDDGGGGQVRVHDAGLIDASAIHVRGGDQDNWGDEGAITAYEDNLTAADTPFQLMDGTSVAYGSFGLDDQRPAVRIDVPGGTTYGDYYSTLTYTISAS